MSDQVFITIISTVGAVVGTALTAKYKDRLIGRPERPKDRMEQIFDGYEKLIREQQYEIKRKGEIIANLEAVANRLEEELAKTKSLLEVVKNDLLQAKEQNKLLTTQLGAMKLEYTGIPSKEEL